MAHSTQKHRDRDKQRNNRHDAENMMNLRLHSRSRPKFKTILLMPTSNQV